MEQYAARAFLCGKIGRLYTVQHTQALGKLRLHTSTVQRHFFVKKIVYVRANISKAGCKINKLQLSISAIHVYVLYNQ